MAQLIYSQRAFEDLERLSDFLRASDPDAARVTVDLICEAVAILARHPLIGRPVEHDLRELVISRGHSGYVALYSHELLQDCVLILAVRHQREVGYGSDLSSSAE